jgi:phage protein U
MMPSDVSSLVNGPFSPDKALSVAALSRVRISEIGSVLVNVAPQLAIQGARLIMEALNNAKNKVAIAAIISPVKLGIGEAMAVEAQNRPLTKPLDGGPGVGSGGASEPSPVEWGSLGDIEFDIVSSPASFGAKDEVVYSQHAVIGAKPRLQYTGSKLQTLTLKIAWDSRIVEDIKVRFEALLKAMRDRTVLPLIIGESTVGSVYAEKYVITSIDHTVAKYNPDGSVMLMEATLNLLEWVDAPDLVVGETTPKAVKETKGKASPSQKAQSQITKDEQGFYRENGSVIQRGGN